MKTTSLKSVFFAATILAVFVSSSAMYAFPKFEKYSKTYLKLREEVKKAGPHDWLTYSNCAEKLIKSRTHMTEAYVWLQESLSINTNPYNLIILGDYYAANNMPFESINAYVDSIKLGIKRNHLYSDIQTINKINAQRKLLYHLK